MSQSISFHAMHFVKSAPNLESCPTDSGIEVALLGRSNAGKSSALNQISGRNGLAKTSKQPGYTKYINIFEIDPQRRLIDLPGYGYAKVSYQERDQMQALLERYIHERQAFYGALLFMDIRHPLTESDRICLEWLLDSGREVHLVLTKSDKLSRSRANATVEQVQRTVLAYQRPITVQAFSSFCGFGTEALQETLQRWFSEEAF